NHPRAAVPCAERPDARLRRGARGARRVARIPAADAAAADPLRELLRQLPRRVCITMTQMPCAHVPIEIKLHQKSRVMELSFSDGSSYRLPYEFLLVFAPSAALR